MDETSLEYDKLRSPRTQQLQHEFGEGFFEGFFNETLSPSALEKLLERPFDYVMTYMMGLWEESSSNESATLGNVAHHVFESIYDKAKDIDGICTADQFENVFDRYYDSIFDEAVRHCGLILTQPENALTCKSLKSRLKKYSIPAYIKVMENNALSIVGSEVDITGTIRCEGHTTNLNLKARIDLLLKDKDSNYVIFDLKHASNKTSRDKRVDQIKKGKDYQLLMYRALVEEKVARGEKVVRGENVPGNVSAVGFFMLTTSELLTAYSFKGVEKIEPELTYTQALRALFTAYEDVMAKLKEGIIKEGEGMVGIDDNGNAKRVPDNSYGENQILKGKLN
jgi:ATP-dependent helicase/DNAse subunit B